MTTSSGLLLVVDDEEMNRDMLSRRLEVEGYEVATAAGGSEALRLMSERHFDAVLLDVMMPVLNGYEVLAEIRRSFSSIELPVLMVTAKNQDEDIVNAFAVGANDYISKPINFPVALARLGCHIASKKLSTRLRESEMRFFLSAQGANDGLWDWNLISDTVFYSTRWKSMLGYAEDAIGDSIEEWLSRVHPEDLPHVKHSLANHQSGLIDQFESEHRMRHQDQTYRWVLTRGVAIQDSSGRQTRMAGSQTDITRGKAADPLTGLPNRVLFIDHLNGAIKASQNNPDFRFAVLFLDLDRFKVINDSLGHDAGDELLVEVARRLESCMRTSDVVSRLNERSTIARFGGDEFVILLNGLRESDNARSIADRILAALAEPYSIKGHSLSTSASIGIAFGPHGECTANDLLRDADIAMYRAKSEGKSRTCLFDEKMKAQAIERLSLEADVRSGFERGEFQVYYQPIVSLPSKHIEGFEALLRWTHPVRGEVSPMEFIPIAEETGFIVELGDWVLEQSCLQLRKWQLEHPAQATLYISVNVSCKQFTDPGLVERVANCLRKTGLHGNCLKLEITESAMMRNPDLAVKALEQLRATGVRISLDDFGTGYSSLSHLQQFPIDTIKIDRSFIQRLGASNQGHEIVKTIIALAHSFGMDVTAEGVEENDQHSKLQDITCENGQGYLYSRPVPGLMIDKLLQENQKNFVTRQPVHYNSNICSGTVDTCDVNRAVSPLFQKHGFAL